MLAILYCIGCNDVKTLFEPKAHFRILLPVLFTFILFANKRNNSNDSFHPCVSGRQRYADVFDGISDIDIHAILTINLFCLGYNVMSLI